MKRVKNNLNINTLFNNKKVNVKFKVSYLQIMIITITLLFTLFYIKSSIFSFKDGHRNNIKENTSITILPTNIEESKSSEMIVVSILPSVASVPSPTQVPTQTLYPTSSFSKGQEEMLLVIKKRMEELKNKINDIDKKMNEASNREKDCIASNPTPQPPKYYKTTANGCPNPYNPETNSFERDPNCIDDPCQSIKDDVYTRIVELNWEYAPLMSEYNNLRSKYIDIYGQK